MALGLQAPNFRRLGGANCPRSFTALFTTFEKVPQDSAEEVEKRNDHYVLAAKCVAILLQEFAEGTRAELRAVALGPDRRKRHVREAKKTKACLLQGTDNGAGRAGQALAGKSLENVDKSLIFGCNPRKLREEWNL
jgi:hypothetical protein